MRSVLWDLQERKEIRFLSLPSGSATKFFALSSKRVGRESLVMSLILYLYRYRWKCFRVKNKKSVININNLA